jgi:hypothetical protein
VGTAVYFVRADDGFVQRFIIARDGLQSGANDGDSWS